MATIYIHLYDPLNPGLSLPRHLFEGGQYTVECLKGSTPDDGEALCRQGKYRIECPQDGWKEVLERLRDSEISLVYSVVDAANGSVVVRESGEMNSTVRHYTTRLGNARQLFAYWFGDDLPVWQMPLVA